MSSPIFEALDAQFSKHRMLFWYDEEGKQKQSFDDYHNPDVEKVVVENNESTVKYHILKAAMVIQELGIDPALEPVVDRHIDFFTNKSEQLEPLEVVLSSLSPDESFQRAVNGRLP